MKVAPYVGAWIETKLRGEYLHQELVAPYVGAWIETFVMCGVRSSLKSHPTWVRGLKLSVAEWHAHNIVAPYVGAWIETQIVSSREAST